MNFEKSVFNSKSTLNGKKILLVNPPPPFLLDEKDFSNSEDDGLFFNKFDFSNEGGYFKGVPGEYSSSVRTKTLSAEKLVELRDLCDKEIRESLGMKQLERMKKFQQ